MCRRVCGGIFVSLVLAELCHSHTHLCLCSCIERKKIEKSTFSYAHACDKRVNTSCISCTNIPVSSVVNEWNVCFEIVNLLPNGCDIHLAFQPVCWKAQNRGYVNLMWHQPLPTKSARFTFLVRKTPQKRQLFQLWQKMCVHVGLQHS